MRISSQKSIRLWCIRITTTHVAKRKAGITSQIAVHTKIVIFQGEGCGGGGGRSGAKAPWEWWMLEDRNYGAELPIHRCLLAPRTLTWSGGEFTHLVSGQFFHQATSGSLFPLAL